MEKKILGIYIAKCASGVLLCSLVSVFLKEWVDYPWSLISVVLVLSPEGKDAMELSVIRIKANLVGALVGVLLLFSRIPSPWNLAVGSALALIICDRFKLNVAARSTLAAMIIILLHQEGSQLWSSALSRIAAVITGCALGLTITYIFHFFIHIEASVINSETIKKEKEV